MADATLKMVANRLKMTINELLNALKEKNIHINANEGLTPEQKQKLVRFLQEHLTGTEAVVTRTKTQQLRGKSNVKVAVKQTQKIVHKTIEKEKPPIKVEPEPLEESAPPEEIKASESPKTTVPVTEKPTVEVQQQVEQTNETIKETDKSATTEPLEPEEKPKKTKAKPEIRIDAGISFVERTKSTVAPIKVKRREPVISTPKPTAKPKTKPAAASPTTRATTPASASPRTKSKSASPHSSISSSAPDELQNKKRKPSKTANSLENKTMDKYKNYLSNLDDDFDQKNRSLRSSHNSIHISAPRHEFKRPVDKIVHTIEIGENIEVSELAQKLSVKASEVIKSLFKLGSPATANESIDQETAIIVAEELGHIASAAKTKEQALKETTLQDEADEVAEPRAPVVTIMGHVDHGKTTLLDTIRKTKVANSEAGGITQHLAAYHVNSDHGQITFIDTPGHAAFTTMRARGARFTDIVVLIVSADDGVMPQTKEIIQHVKAAEVPLIVAINKMDKPEANPDNVLQGLSQEDVITEAWGGEIPSVNISAKTAMGIEELLETISLQAEILELSAPVEGQAQGTVLECRLDKGRGIVTKALIQRGTLKIGDNLLVGTTYGKVRALLDDNDKNIKKAGPSIPVEIMGLTEMPKSGDELICVKNDKQAREIAELRQQKNREELLRKQRQSQLSNLFETAQESKTVNLVVKTDTHGSLEALNDAFTNLANDEIEVKIVGHSIGGIRESDVSLAMAHNAIVIGFNVRADSGARKIAERDNIDIKYYSIIYEAIEQVKQAMEGKLSPTIQEDIIGVAEVRDVFRAPKIGQIAGCMVIEGVVKRNQPIRVLRDDVVIYEGALESLKRFKEDVNEVRNNIECGIGVKNYNDVKVGDKIEVFERTEIKRTL